MVKIGDYVQNPQLDAHLSNMLNDIETRLSVVNSSRLQAQDTKKEAGSQGDLRENFDYHAAAAAVVVYSHEAKALEDSKIALETFKNKRYRHTGYISHKSLFTLDMGKYGGVKTFTLVIPEAGDFQNGYIPSDSVIGQAVRGKKVGDTIRVETGFHSYTATVTGIDTNL